jgi:uncharacterized protein YkwD
MSALAKRLIGAALLASLVAGISTIGGAASVAAVSQAPSALVSVPTAIPVPSATAAAMARSILMLMNRDRIARGVRPLAVNVRLAGLALERARWMAVRGVMTHNSAGGTILMAEISRGVRPSIAGECVGWTNASWGSTAARYLYDAWKHSPEHWSLMMSSDFTLVGIGFGYRSTGHVTYGSLVFARL